MIPYNLVVGGFVPKFTLRQIESLVQPASIFRSQSQKFARAGGVDSSYIQAHLCQHLGHSVRTFSVDLAHPSWEIEREYARSGSALFQTNHTFVKVNPSEYPKLLFKTISEAGLPLRNAQRALNYKLFRSIKETSSVAISGMAGDALFGLELCQHIDIAHLIKRFMPSKASRNIIFKIAKSWHKNSGLVIL